ncbi:hypothetical protein Nepgr_008902 [Nepenthes gracilis]|uniref:Uncharacterized protein n=1 Tax=Nepenthes gracilis TaxID=150966 RepID=A0AAD3XJN7_NEPGR|nr:hypothetical protein Nepgr_008902 [Nepenthes gracilis]
MPKKGQELEPKASPPEISSSEELGSEEEEELSSEDEEEDTLPSTPPPQPLQVQSYSHPKVPSQRKSELSSVPAKPAQPQQGSSSESDSIFDSDSDSPPPRRPEPNVKPVASKSMDDGSSKRKKPRSKANLKPVVASLPASSAAKRPAEPDGETAGKDAKKAKKEKYGEATEEVAKKKVAEDPKKQLFQRVWSEDDEIAVLKGMIEYTAKKGRDPAADADDFREFIKRSLHVDLDKRQIMNKVRRLKKKYENNVKKNRSLSGHERDAFDLSKTIWGTKRNSNAVVINQDDNNAKPGINLKASGEDIDVKMAVPLNFPREIYFGKDIAGMGLDENIVKEGLKLLDSNKRAELDEKWRTLKLAEVELYLKRVDLVREQTRLILDAMKSAEH